MRSDEADKVSPEPAPKKKHRPCPHCGGEDIIHRLPLFADAQGVHVVGSRAVGLAHHTDQRYLLGGEIIKIAPLHLNLCRSCGTVTRIYIDNPDDEDWVKPRDSSPLA